MTYLDWGCDPLAAECESCLDALCNACNEQFRKKSGTNTPIEGLEVACDDNEEPDCDHCDLEKKPDCSRCEIIHTVCRSCSGNPTCEFRISD